MVYSVVFLSRLVGYKLDGRSNDCHIFLSLWIYTPGTLIIRYHDASVREVALSNMYILAVTIPQAPESFCYGNYLKMW